MVNDISIRREGGRGSGLTNFFRDFGPAKRSPQQSGWPLLSPAWTPAHRGKEKVLGHRCSPHGNNSKCPKYREGHQLPIGNCVGSTRRRHGSWRRALVGLVFVVGMESGDSKRSYCAIVNRNTTANMKLNIPLTFSYLRTLCETVLRIIYRELHLLRSDCAIELVSSTGPANYVL